MPTLESLDLAGLEIPAADLRALTSVDVEGWKKEASDIARYYEQFGERLPLELKRQLQLLRERLG